VQARRVVQVPQEVEVVGPRVQLKLALGNPSPAACTWQCSGRFWNKLWANAGVHSVGAVPYDLPLKGRTGSQTGATQHYEPNAPTTLTPLPLVTGNGSPPRVECIGVGVVQNVIRSTPYCSFYELQGSPCHGENEEKSGLACQN
jgi:hypothetical protein